MLRTMLEKPKKSRRQRQEKLLPRLERPKLDKMISSRKKRRELPCSRRKSKLNLPSREEKRPRR